MRRSAFALTALFAVLLQAFVVQTHIHAPVAPIGAGIERIAEGSTAPIASVSAPDEHQAFACVVCQTLASGVSAILTQPVSGLITAEATSEAATYTLPRAPPIASHSWQSRAPPTNLQA